MVKPYGVTLKFIYAFLVVLLTTTPSLLTHAQEVQKNNRELKVSAEEINSIDRRLKLTAPQKQQANALFKKRERRLNEIIQDFRRSSNDKDKEAARDLLGSHQRQTYNGLRKILRPVQVRELEQIRKQHTNQFKAATGREDEGPILFGICWAACELACIALPPGPICDCTFCSFLLWIPD